MILAFDMKFPLFICYILVFRSGEISCLNWAFGIWHEISPFELHYMIFLKWGNFMSEQTIWCLTWIFPISWILNLAPFGFFLNWGNLMSDAICYVLYGIWYEKSPLGHLWHFLKRFHTTWEYFMSDARILYNNWHNVAYDMKFPPLICGPAFSTLSVFEKGK